VSRSGGPIADAGPATARNRSWPIATCPPKRGKWRLVSQLIYVCGLGWARDATTGGGSAPCARSKAWASKDSEPQ